jgi:hypothetical protein
MKKLIDIPDEIVKDLKKLAIDENKDLKNFIQDHLILLVRGRKKNKKLPLNLNRSGQVAMEYNLRLPATKPSDINHIINNLK